MPDHAFIAATEGSSVAHVGTYRRVLPVSLERMFENALDWEHLPFLHSSSFADIECDEAGAWGWRAWVGNHDGSRSLLQLSLDKRLRRWVTRNLEGPNSGAEIWTYVLERGARELEIVVDFFVPGVPDEAKEKVGRAYARAYERLYDEDVEMMTGRQTFLDLRVTPAEPTTVELGPVEALSLPVRTEFAGKPVIVNRTAGTLVCYPARCPHQAAPLDVAQVADGVLTCPWHGYQFDVASGECVSGHPCRLVTGCTVVERQGIAYLEAS